jgi:hypothetical protein
MNSCQRQAWTVTGGHGSVPYDKHPCIEPAWFPWLVKKNCGSFTYAKWFRLLPTEFPTKILFVFLAFTMRATRPAHFILHLITLASGEDFALENPS